MRGDKPGWPGRGHGSYLQRVSGNARHKKSYTYESNFPGVGVWLCCEPKYLRSVSVLSRTSRASEPYPYHSQRKALYNHTYDQLKHLSPEYKRVAHLVVPSFTDALRPSRLLLTISVWESVASMRIQIGQTLEFGYLNLTIRSGPFILHRPITRISDIMYLDIIPLTLHMPLFGNHYLLAQRRTGCYLTALTFRYVRFQVLSPEDLGSI